MGKRELLIVIAFVATGVVAFELTAPPAPEGRGFSFARFWQGARRGMRGNQAVASTTLSGQIPVGPTLTELRVGGANRGIHVVGEPRENIAYELHVEAAGPDQATALEAAKRASLKQDDLGSTLALTVTFQRETSEWGALLLRVPARLAVRVDSVGGVEISGVAAAALEQVVGTATIRSVAGTVTGSHRNGDLTIADVGAIDLMLTGSRARVTGVARNLALTSRAGRCEIDEAHGEIEIDQTGEETTVHGPSGPVHVSGTGGRIVIERPRQEVKVDCRRTEVDVALNTEAPLTLLTTDETLRLTLEGPPAITLDAAASDGTIRGEGIDLEVKASDGEQRCAAIFGNSKTPARVTLRTTRGSIVIRGLK